MLRRLAVFAACGASAAAQTNVPVSVSSAGALANNNSYYSLVSAGGRYVVFQSEASNLVSNDFNARYDIFRRDLQSGTTELVSVGLSGNAASGLGLSPAVSGDGRYVAWSSDAANLVTGDSNATWDVFLRDMVAGVTTRLSLDSGGNQVSQRSDQPRMTPDARFVVFESDAALIPADTNGLKDCYRLDRTLGLLELVSADATGAPGNSISYAAEPSHDGRYVVFFSNASNLVAGDTNNWADVFRKDMQTGAVARANVSTAGVQANNETIWPSISGDGQTVTFCSVANTLVSGDTNGQWDLFARDMLGGVTTRLNVQPSGLQANSYVRSPSALSYDGRFVIFASLSTNLVAGDTNGFQDVFLRDRQLQVTQRLSVDFSGGEANDDAFVPHMTPDTRVITFTSEASDVVPGDINGYRDIFAATLFGGFTTYCTAGTSTNGCLPAISATGTPSAGATSGFAIQVSNLEGQKQGLLFYGLSGQLALPWATGSSSFLCVKTPTQRMNLLNSGGSAGLCDGVLAQDWLAFVAANPAALGAPFSSGQVVDAQAWYRDPSAVKTTNLSNALEFTLVP